MAEPSVSPGPSSSDSSENLQEESFISSFIAEVVKSPLNIFLVIVIAILVYKIFRSKTQEDIPVQEHKELPKIRKDFTVEELKKYDGRGPDGRILVAVNGSVYDVTRGSRFYGPGKLIIIYLIL